MIEKQPFYIKVVQLKNKGILPMQILIYWFNLKLLLKLLVSSVSVDVMQHLLLYCIIVHGTFFVFWPS